MTVFGLTMRSVSTEYLLFGDMGVGQARGDGGGRVADEVGRTQTIMYNFRIIIQVACMSKLMHKSPPHLVQYEAIRFCIRAAAAPKSAVAKNIATTTITITLSELLTPGAHENSSPNCHVETKAIVAKRSWSGSCACA